jgi:hypothetical protein
MPGGTRVCPMAQETQQAPWSFDQGACLLFRLLSQSSANVRDLGAEHDCKLSPVIPVLDEMA